jgi:uncharacterized small protein (DUF1192 family)
MAAWQLEEAREHLKRWLDAEMAVAMGQSYRIGSRELTRANVADIRERINYWRREVERLESGRSGIRVLRGVPRDL